MLATFGRRPEGKGLYPFLGKLLAKPKLADGISGRPTFRCSPNPMALLAASSSSLSRFLPGSAIVSM